MAVKYLDNAGTQYLVNKIKAIDGKIPTESQITTMITTALNTYKEGIVTIVESLPQTGEEGKLYLLVDPSDSDVYIIYTWEENAFKRMGSKTFTLTVDSALSSTSTNPVQNKVIKSALDGKANSSHTHGSITNDGKLGTASRVVITGTDKKIGISTVTTTELGYLSGVTSAIQTQLNSKSATGHTHTAGDVAGLATVATSGSYNDLSNKPSIPTKTSDLTNDSNFVDTSNPAVSSGITSAKVTDYDTHIADTDIHVTTADKTKWNNGVSQAYVFRYSSTVLIASSTNSNTLLDNTDNLKVGDKVIDSNGVLFSITAIDTANSTFTVGSALIDLALDANVVHTSGDETISGFKTFSSTLRLTAYPSIRMYMFDDEWDVQPSIPKQSEIRFTDKNSVIISYFAFQHRADSNEPFRTCWRQQKMDGTNSYYSIDFNNLGDFYPENNNAITLGGTSNRWKSVYAMSYYYGNDNIEFSTKFVTTDTAQTITGNKTFSSDLTVANTDTTSNTPNLNLRNYRVDRVTTDTGAQSISFLDKNAKALTLIESRRTSNGNTGTNILTYNTDDSNNTVSGGVTIIKGKTYTNFAPNTDNAVTCGRPLAKWSGVYSTEYYYGANNTPFTDKFVTTDTAQTITGEKTFSSRPIIYNASATVQADVPNLVLKNPLVERASTTLDGEQTILFTDKNDNNIGSIQAKTYTSGISDIILTSYSEYDGVKTTGIMIRRTPTTSKLQGYSDNITDLGDTNRRWRRVYAMSYYYGSDNIEFSTKFVTTDTNQTISGNKTFSSNTYVYNSDNTATTPNLYLKSSKVEVSSQGNTSGDQNLVYLDKNNTVYAYVKGAVQSNGSAVKIRAVAKDSSDNSVINELQMLAYTNGNKAIFPSYSNEIDLGVSNYKWKSFNGVEPSSLSLPDLSNSIDISSYITDLTGNPNAYSPPANGYIAIRSTTANVLGIVENTTGMGSYSRGSNQVLGVYLPVVKNSSITIYAICSSLSQAKFIPCQGNV